MMWASKTKEVAMTWWSSKSEEVEMDSGDLARAYKACESGDHEKALALCASLRDSSSHVVAASLLTRALLFWRPTLHEGGVGVWALSERLLQDARAPGQPQAEARNDFVAAMFKPSPDASVSAVEVYVAGAWCDLVRNDTAEGVRLYTLSAGSSFAPALYSLAVCLGLGEGVTRDVAGARRMYERAVETGHSQAMNNLAKLLDDEAGEGADSQQALDLYRRSAKAGSVVAAYNLGRRLTSPTRKMSEEERAEAVEVFKEAARLGDPRALALAEKFSSPTAAAAPVASPCGTPQNPPSQEQEVQQKPASS